MFLLCLVLTPETNQTQTNTEVLENTIIDIFILLIFHSFLNGNVTTSLFAHFIFIICITSCAVHFSRVALCFEKLPTTHLLKVEFWTT